jgi:hypothetical protein
LVEVAGFSEATARGENGFGSTGVGQEVAEDESSLETKKQKIN